MRVEFVNIVGLCRELKSLDFLCDASFQSTFHGIASQIIGAVEFSTCEEDLCLFDAQIRQHFKVAPKERRGCHAGDSNSVAINGIDKLEREMR